VPELRRFDCRISPPITLVQGSIKPPHLDFHNRRIIVHDLIFCIYAEDIIHDSRESGNTDLISGLFLSGFFGGYEVA